MTVLITAALILAAAWLHKRLVQARGTERDENAAWWLTAEQQLRGEAAPRPNTTNGPDQQPGTNDLLLAECQAIWRASSRTHRTAARLYTLLDRIGGQL